jgi:adenylate cyclase
VTKGNIDRRLAAILMADVVSYSRLMGDHETETLQSLQEHQFALINPMIGQHHGRVVKLMGDGMLVEYHSVTEAVECAVAIQRGMKARNTNVAEDRQIRFRIGINVGDVIIDGEDIYGDGINIASCLQELAEPDGFVFQRRCLGRLKELSITILLMVEHTNLRILPAQ